MNRIIALSLILLIGRNAYSQNLLFQWVSPFSGSNYVEVLDMAQDADGNIIAVGNFIATADFDPSANTSELASAGGFDGFICKLDPMGQFIWARAVSGTESQSSKGVAIDGDGNIYVTGAFYGTTEFDGGPNSNEVTSAASGDAYVLKLDVNGNFVWVQTFGNLSNQSGDAIVCDADDNVIVAGTFQGTVDFDPGIGTQNLTANGSSADVFFLRLTPTGDFSYVKRFGGTGSDLVRKLSSDMDNNIYFAGHYSATATFTPGSTLNITAEGNTDAIVGKLNSSGALSWARSFGGSQADSGFDVEIDDQGNVYATGYFRWLVDFLPGSGVLQFVAEGESDGFVVKINNGGTFQWARQLGGINFDYAQTIAITSASDVVVAGHFYDTADFDPNPNATAEITSVDGPDLFITALTANGDHLWVDHFSGTDDQVAHKLLIDQNENLILAGAFEGTVDFDSGSGTEERTSAGSLDGFILRLSTLTVGAGSVEMDPKEIMVFPNPSTDQLNLVLPQAAAATIEIFDVAGCMVFTHQMTGKTLSLQPDLPAGTYIFSVRTDEKVTTLPVIIH
ncbi:MAG: T9SS type A sorting domain-containing protein [Flavobacteriales bacterium]|nr:T9SS type A sorting domain-containing protein [Flavobacteriales bacterium]